MLELSPTHSQVLSLLHREGRLSRSDLHERTGIRPNTIGALVGDMLAGGLIRTCEASARGRGRPRVPVEIDPSRRYVVGLALQPGGAEVVRVNLKGRMLGSPRRSPVSDAGSLVGEATQLLAETLTGGAVSVGVTVPGFVDLDAARILASSATPGLRETSLSPLVEAAKPRPLVLSSEVHALSARWKLVQPGPVTEDVLLATLKDGAFGASLLIAGRPNRGCVTAGNELGHTRLPVRTDRCYCGEVGCAERVFSTSHLHRLDPDASRRGLTLQDRALQLTDDPASPADPSLDRILGDVGMVLANACNFVRPHRLVLAGPLTSHGPFARRLTDAIRRQTLAPLRNCIAFELWPEHAIGTAATAAWLALVRLLSPQSQEAVA